MSSYGPYVLSTIFFVALAAFLIWLVVYFVVGWFRHDTEEVTRKLGGLLVLRRPHGVGGVLCTLFFAVLAVFCSYQGYQRVIDLAAVGNPERVTLEDLSFDVYDGTYTTIYHMDGVDPYGNKYSFEIDPDSYSEGEAQLEEGDQPLYAHVSYLPNSMSVVELYFSDELDQEAISQLADQAALGDGLDSYALCLFGHTYTLPCPVSEFLDNGWQFMDDQDASTQVEARNPSYGEIYAPHESVGLVRTNNPDVRISVEAANFSGSVQEAKDCWASGVEVSMYGLASANLLLPGDLVATTVSSSELADAYGTPDTGDGDRLEYRAGTEDRGWSFTFDDDSLSWVVVEAPYPAYQADDGETLGRLPDELSAYSAPTSMGEDLSSGTISIDGDLYQLYCPVGALLDNGWQVESVLPSAGDVTETDTLDSLELASGDTMLVSFTRGDDHHLRVFIKNTSTQKNDAKYCAVCEFNASTSNDTSWEIPGVSAGDAQADVESRLGQTLEQVSDDYLSGKVSVSCADGQTRDCSVQLFFDKDTGAAKTVYFGFG